MTWLSGPYLQSTVDLNNRLIFACIELCIFFKNLKGQQLSTTVKNLRFTPTSSQQACLPQLCGYWQNTGDFSVKNEELFTHSTTHRKSCISTSVLFASQTTEVNPHGCYAGFWFPSQLKNLELRKHQTFTEAASKPFQTLFQKKTLSFFYCIQRTNPHSAMKVDSMFIYPGSLLEKYTLKSKCKMYKMAKVVHASS